MRSKAFVVIGIVAFGAALAHRAALKVVAVEPAGTVVRAEPEPSTDPRPSPPHTHDTQPVHAAVIQPTEDTQEALSADEDHLIIMYEEIQAAFAAHEHDCDAMGQALGDAVDDHSAGIKQWSAAQAKLTPQEQTDTQARVFRVAGPRITRAQESLRVAMDACAPNQHFQEALRKLALLNTPG